VALHGPNSAPLLDHPLQLRGEASGEGKLDPAAFCRSTSLLEIFLVLANLS